MAYFTTAEFRALMPDMDDEPKYPDERIEHARDVVEALIEQACGTSFVARSVTETVDGSGRDGLLLSAPYVQSITTVTVDGVVESGYTYTFADGVLERNSTGGYTPTAWSTGRRNVTVAYVAGWSTEPPNDLKDAAMWATRDRVIRMKENSGGPSQRATSISNDLGGTTQFQVAGTENPTGLPEVDATIMRWARYVRIPGIA